MPSAVDYAVILAIIMYNTLNISQSSSGVVPINSADSEIPSDDASLASRYDNLFAATAQSAESYQEQYYNYPRTVEQMESRSNLSIDRRDPQVGDDEQFRSAVINALSENNVAPGEISSAIDNFMKTQFEAYSKEIDIDRQKDFKILIPLNLNKDSKMIQSVTEHVNLLISY